MSKTDSSPNKIDVDEMNIPMLRIVTDRSGVGYALGGFEFFDYWATLNDVTWSKTSDICRRNGIQDDDRIKFIARELLRKVVVLTELNNSLISQQQCHATLETFANRDPNGTKIEAFQKCPSCRGTGILVGWDAIKKESKPKKNVEGDQG